MTAALILLVVPVLTLVQIVRLHHEIPWGDNLTLFVHNRMADGLTAERLFGFHNEHLVIPTKLAVYADYLLWRGANILPSLAAVFGVIAIIALYARLLCRRHDDWSSAQATFATSVLAVLLLNGRMTWTLTCPILLTHVSANLLATVAIAAYAGLVSGNRHPALSWAIFATTAVTAATASASGILVIPAAVTATLVCVAISPSLRSRPWPRPTAVATAIGAVLIVAYCASYLASGASHATGRRPDLAKAFRFAVYFIGGAFLRDSDWPVVSHPDGLVLHVIVLGFWAVFAWTVRETWRRRNTLGAFDLFHACVLSFVIVTAATGGLFRANLGELESLNKKYAPTALLAWASLASLIMHYRGDVLAAGATAGLKAMLMAILILMAILPGDRVEYMAWHGWRRQLREAAMAFASGVHNEVLLKRFFPDEQMARDLVTAVHDDSAYVFRRLPRLGESLTSRYLLPAYDKEVPTIEAAVSVASPTDTTARVAVGRMSGSIDDSLPNIIVADDAGRVIGYGNASYVGLDGRKLQQPEWFASYHSQVGSRAFVFAIDDERAEPIGVLPAVVQDAPPTPAADETASHRLERVPDHTDYGLDFLNDVETPLFRPPARISAEDVIRFSGWAVDRASCVGAARVEVVIDGHVYPARHGMPRYDVATYLHQPGFAESGFEFTTQASRFARGDHRFFLRIFLADGESFLQSPTGSFVVE